MKLFFYENRLPYLNFFYGETGYRILINFFNPKICRFESFLALLTDAIFLQFAFMSGNRFNGNNTF